VVQSSGLTNVGNGPDQNSDWVEPRYMAIGRVIRAHGIRGELSVAVLTDFPERFEATEWVYLGNEYQADRYHLENYRWHKKNVLLTLGGVTDRTQAEQLKGQLVQVPIEEAVALPEGGYYLFQLIGLRVVTTTGAFLGELTDILETKANDVLIVTDQNQKEVLLPAIPDVIRSIDLAQGQVVVEIIDGLI